MSVRSIRITEEIETAVRYVADREHAAQAQSLRKLARMGFEAYVAGLILPDWEVTEGSDAMIEAVIR